MVKVFCKNTGTFKEFQEGTTLLDALKEFDREFDTCKIQFLMQKVL